MISQYIQLFRNGLEYNNADIREKQWRNKKVKAKEETANENVFIHLTI